MADLWRRVPSWKRLLLYWMPRALCIFFIVFVSLFALDAFNERGSFGRMMVALCIHLLPSAILILFLLISWRWEWVGGIAFMLLPFLYVERMGGISRAYPVIFIPLVLISVLFWVGWIQRCSYAVRERQK